jgi:integrase
MGTVNFYLKKPEPNGKSLIFLRYYINGKPITFSFGQTIEVKNWNRDKQRVKSNRFTTEDGRYSLNDLLDNLERICKQTYYKELSSGIPQPATIKKALTNFIYQRDESSKITLYSLIERFIKNEIKFKGKNKSESTIRVYVSTYNHLKEFEAIKKYPIEFDTITLAFYYDFISYLENRETKYKDKLEALRNKPVLQEDGTYAVPKKKRPIVDLGVNTIGKYISKIILFMGEANELGYTTNKDYLNKKFIVPKEDTDAVYLNEDELDKLYKYDLSNNSRLERVRDLFIFGSYVGLRYQDYSSIRNENIVSYKNEEGEVEYYLKVITQKTKEVVYIPCHPLVLEIFKKYDENNNRLPEAISNQNFNEYIKEVCKLAGFTEKGRLLEEPEKELWECISSHTARRNFATNWYLDGVETIDLMKMTGHRTEKSFLTYIKVSKLNTAKRLNQHMKKQWERKKQKAFLSVA